MADLKKKDDDMSAMYASIAEMFTGAKELIRKIDADNDGSLSKNEVMSFIPQFEKDTGMKLPAELMARLEQIPDSEKLDLSKLQSLSVTPEQVEAIVTEKFGSGDALNAAISQIETRVSEIMSLASTQAPNTEPAGENISTITQQVAGLLRDFDNGKGLTAFAKNGNLKGKELDSVIEFLNEPQFADDKISQGVKRGLQSARENGEKVDINQFVTDINTGLHNADRNSDGALSPTEIAQLGGGNSTGRQ